MSSVATSYDDALSELYQAPHGSFVAERKRLSAELKAAGDKPSAQKFAKLVRPPLSAWAVNQLWWHARSAFEELFDAAGHLRAGKLSARDAHRKALAALTTRAQKLLTDSGHAANDATLRRINMTLSGLAASGSFEPDPNGALTKDRDPPGFEAFGIDSSSEGESEREDEPPTPATRESKEERPAKEAARAADTHKQAEAKRREAAAAKRAEEAAAAEKKRLAERRAQQQAKRRELEGALREAKQALAASEQEHTRIARELAAATRAVEHAQSTVEQAQQRLQAQTDAD